MKPTRRRVEVNLEELDRVLDGARQAPLSEADYDKLKEALHTLAMLVRPRSTEKTKAVLEESGMSAPGIGIDPEAGAATPPGHGRNGAAAFGGASKVKIAHQQLKHGDRCPGCEKGNVYGQKEPKVLVRIVGQAPLAATVYSLERLRCGACGQIFTAQEPEGVGPEKYDETAAAMIAQLKYGSGVPFHRLEQLEAHLGIPMPAATQWDIVEEAAELIKPAGDELIRQAAQGEVLHNDDTSMRVLKMTRPAGDERTGVFTSGIVSTGECRRIALFFTGRQHAGENMADVMKHRAAELPHPIQMCDALSRNIPKLAPGVEILLALCLAHGRRQFVEVAANFPQQCRYVLEMLGQVYGYDAEAREQVMTPAQRLQFHQQRSGPVMEQLHRWLEMQLAERKTEPNSGLGKAILYLLRHWKGLTLFLREAGAPIDNNVVERSLKRVVLHRKNALFYRTLNGAQVGDLYMTLIHTCQLCSANSFDYLLELQRHAPELAARPAEWMPWNYRETLARTEVG
ncbi:MAG TPA: IS66 family transposase [Bryobacteraceae bacterium]|nr:IS66 family transposase [Bryobacteraceae bacterium]